MVATRNTAAPEPHTIHLAGPDNERLVFAGPPNGLTGKIPLINDGTEKQKIRTIAVNTEQLQGAARLPIREFPLYAKLYGGQQTTVPATIALDSQTPPGSYDFEVTVGKRTLAATAHVSELVDLRIDPTQMTILAGAGRSYTRTLVVENAGNVPLPTGAQCEAPIFDSFDLVSSLLIGLHNSDRQSAESMTRAFLNEWAELQAGTLIIKRKALTINPGQTIKGEVEFLLPAELKPQRHYRASLQLYNASLAIDIYTTAKFRSE